MLTLLGNPPLCCSQIMGSLTRRDGAFPTTNPARTSHVNSPSQPTMGSRPFHSLNCGLLPPSIVRHLCRSCPHSLMDSPICLWAPHFLLFLFILLLLLFLSRSSHHTVGAPSLRSGAPPLLTVGLLPFSLWAPLLLTVSLGSSLPQHGALSHRTQVRGSSPSSHGGPLPATIRGLSSILVARLSPFLSGGSPALPGAHPHLVHSTVGLPHISVGLPHIAVGLFTIYSWGIVSL